MFGLDRDVKQEGIYKVFRCVCRRGGAAHLGANGSASIICCQLFVLLPSLVANEREIPFYVDFKVGEAVKHLCATDHRVIAQYKASTNRLQGQTCLLQRCESFGDNQ